MVYIESLLPNPTGQDAGNEWIKITGDGTSAENMYGWQIKDDSGGTFYLNDLGTIQPNESIELRQTGITLNNDGDSVVLLNKEGVEVDRLGYSESVTEGEIIFSGRSLAEQPARNSVALANISETGIINSNLLNNGALEPLLLGFAVAAVSTMVFLYLRKNLSNEDE